MISGYLKVKRLNFKSDVFKYQKFYPFYSGCVDKTRSKNSTHAYSDSDYDIEDNIYIVRDIPPYFDLIPNQKVPSLEIITLFQFEGFMANLSSFQSIDDYVNFQMGTKSRSKIRGYRRRLETCFNVKYRFIFGTTIDTEEYYFLFRKFKYLIEKRFEQRGDIHESLKNWSTIEKETLSMIWDKKASLFVIYDNAKPIDICLNYHYNNIYYNAIRSYDIDYSKFRLGYIDILVQLEWCFANNYQFFDLGRGDLEYKRRWCNETYKFQQHIIYNKNLFNRKLTAILIAKITQGKSFLKKKNVHLIYRQIKSLFNKKQKPRIISHTEMKNNISNPIIDTNDSIDISIERYAFLRKYAYDFQYLNFESSENIRLYKCKKVSNSYLIQGKSKNQLITLGSNA